MCRNPLYLFSLLGSIGVGFATKTVTVPAILAALIGLFYPLLIRMEEAKLRVLHGDDFARYCASVPRFLPRFSQIVEPDKYIARPGVFRRAISDCVWFVWLVGIIELAESLRKANILPVLAMLY
jgi:hypothetical protein